MEGLLWPPERASPSPSRTRPGSPSPTASWCSVSCLTRLARTRDRSPSGRSFRRPYSRAATERLRTESPRNSSRSLCSAEKLRCVRARAISLGSWKRCCSRSCSAARASATGRNLPSGARLPLVLQREPGRAEQVELLLVGEGDLDLVAVLGDGQVLARDGADVVHLRVAVERRAHGRYRRF